MYIFEYVEQQVIGTAAILLSENVLIV